MEEIINIAHPFLTVEDFRRRAGNKLARLIHRLAGKYPQLSKSCGMGRMLLALSVAWGMTGIAKAGDISAFEHIDEALSPPSSFGCITMPPWGCVMVEGQPFFIAEGEQGVLRFLWDGFTIFIDYEGTQVVSQSFFDFADTRQTRAYMTMGEEYSQLSNDKTYEANVIEEAKETNNEARDEAHEEAREEAREEAHEEARELEKTKVHDDCKEKPENVQENVQQDMQQDVQQDVLADFVDTALTINNPEGLKLVSIVMDHYCVDAVGEAQHAAMQQAMRLHYFMEYNQVVEYNQELANNKRKGNHNMGDSYTFNVQGDYVKGDKVMGNKYVGKCQDAENEEHLKNALTALMDEEGDDGKPLFQTQAQWFAVYRILSDDYGWKVNALSEFCRRINALGMKWQVACKVDGIKKVNQIAPFYKAFSEWEPQGNLTAYNRQEQVANKFKQLMEEEEA